jgi:hypothetical protein
MDNTQQRLDNIDGHFRQQAIVYERTRAEQELQQLQAEGFAFDHDAELDRLGGSLDGTTPAMTSEQRTRHLAYMRQNHRMAPGSFRPPSNPLSREQLDQVLHYIQRHPDTSYRAALTEALRPPPIPLPF